MKWIKELFNPALKCERVGHTPKTETVRYRKRANDGLTICNDYKAKRDRCSRCGTTLTDFYDEKKTNGYTGVSMPTDYWEEMKTKGYLEL